MSYYGVLNTSTDEKTTSMEKTVEESLESVKPIVDRFIDGVRNELWSDIENYLVGDCASNIRNTIARECEQIIESFLIGDEDVIKKTNIISKYTFGKLPEVRRAIFNACAEDLQKQIIFDLESENKRLREGNDYLRNRGF